MQSEVERADLSALRCGQNPCKRLGVRAKGRQARRSTLQFANHPGVNRPASACFRPSRNDADEVERGLRTRSARALKSARQRAACIRIIWTLRLRPRGDAQAGFSPFRLARFASQPRNRLSPSLSLTSLTFVAAKASHLSPPCRSPAPGSGASPDWAGKGIRPAPRSSSTLSESLVRWSFSESRNPALARALPRQKLAPLPDASPWSSLPQA